MILKKIRIVGDKQAEKYKDLFQVVEKLYGIKISHEISLNESDAIISFIPGSIPAGYPNPTLEYQPGATGTGYVNTRIKFIKAEFDGVSFSNKDFQTISVPVDEELNNYNSDDHIIAEQDNKVIWYKKTNKGSNNYYSAVPPIALPNTAYSLKEYFCKENFIALFPLLVLLRDVLGDQVIMPKRKASFIVDDPNMHSGSYGYINYKKLCREAQDHNYHVSIATIPLDNLWASKKTVKLFNDNKLWISPIIHGNNHSRAEFLMRDREKIISTLFQINKRIGYFKNKYALEIQDVLTAPHGMISRELLRAVSYFDYSGVVNARPFPWYPYGTKKENINETKYYTRWFPADFIDGTPIIPRMSEKSDVPFKLFLNIPCVFTLHHWDFKNGYNHLKETADYVNSFAAVKWAPMGEIFKKNFIISGKDRDTFSVHLLSKKIYIDIPESYKNLKINLFNNTNLNQDLRVSIFNESLKLEKAADDIYSSPEISLNGHRKLEISIKDYGKEPLKTKTKILYLPILRRVLTESRDRIRPFTKK